MTARSLTYEEELELLDVELATRHVAQRSTGLIRLPKMAPKPEPPPEFWTRAESSMDVPLVTAKAAAQAVLKKFAEDRRFGRKPKTEVVP